MNMRREMNNFSNLKNHQLLAIEKLKNGCILCGGVGTGKSRTSIAYYYKECGGNIYDNNFNKMTKPKTLYIITTAQKRDNLEWELELNIYGLSALVENLNDTEVIVDSWNNIQKYKDVKDSFVIFDEQRLVGYGVWVKAFLKIAKNNDWILLTATPADVWMDYLAVFIANDFYKNKTDFTRQHVIWSRRSKFPKIDGYYNTVKLNKCRRAVLVTMKLERTTKQIHSEKRVEYDIPLYKLTTKERKNPYKDDLPIKNISELCFVWRKIVNSDISRINVLKDLLNEHKRIILFYNFDYELDILRSVDWGVTLKEYNGHRHDPVPTDESWLYLVQYTAGSEGWNCISTDTIVFYSQNYSYRTMIQAAGRIDRMNTSYTNLYYYHLKSKAPIDLAIGRSLKNKRKFNETSFVSDI